MTEKSFRILLDLTDLKNDSLKYIWINVSPQELLTIADLKLSILRKINLENINIKLYVCKGLLLDSETTTILRENDTVKVHYADQLISEENTLEKIVKESRKSSRKRIHAECISESSTNANEFSKEGDVFENKSNQDEINTKHKRKKSKKLHSSEPEISCTQSTASETNNLQKLESHKKKNKKQKTSEKNVTEINEFFSFNNSECKIVGNKGYSSQDTTLVNSDFSKTNLSKDISSVDNVSLEVESEIKDQSRLKAVTEDSNVLNNTTTKKKRKRHRKRKKVNETTSEIPDNTNNRSEFKSFVCEASKSYQGKHVKYSLSPSKDEVTGMDCDDGFKDIKSPNAQTFVFNGSLSNCTAESSYNYPKVSTPVWSNKLENPNWCLSGVQNSNINSTLKVYKKDLELPATNSISNDSWNCTHTKSYSRQSEEFETKEMQSTTNAVPKSYSRQSEEFEIKEKPFATNSVLKSSLKSTLTKSCSRQSEEFGTEEKQSEKTYSELPPLNSRPDVGTHIAYKILELDEHYSPVVSDYREGIVKSINFENEEMEIELLKHVIKPGRTGKFENLSEGEVPLPEVKKYDTVKWSSLVEPKLISC